MLQKIQPSILQYDKVYSYKCICVYSECGNGTCVIVIIKTISSRCSLDPSFFLEVYKNKLVPKDRAFILCAFFAQWVGASLLDSLVLVAPLSLLNRLIVSEL